jgi:hypothetical protein
MVAIERGAYRGRLRRRGRLTILTSLCACDGPTGIRTFRHSIRRGKATRRRKPAEAARGNNSGAKWNFYRFSLRALRC